MTIWKFVIGKANDVVNVGMPKDAKILSVAMQAGQLCLWALVEPRAELTMRAIRVIGTGWDLADDIKKAAFIGTVLDGAFVWHVFEVTT